MTPDKEAAGKFPYRITFMTTPEQSAFLDMLAAQTMTNVSSVLRQIIQPLYVAYAGGTVPRPNGHAETREIA